jgi:1-deoxy-D-xylulose-5-phosphate reductoisomerase
VVGLAAGSNSDKLLAQHREFSDAKLALYSDVQGCGIPSGIEALCDLATADDVDLVVVAVAGVIGLLPTIRAIQAGKHIALASKEVLVAAGEVVMPLIRKHRVTLTPIDSEHSAIFQCVQGYRPDQIDSLILTASGGPFRGKKREDLRSVAVEDALAHPTWRMGGKITIDSATLMNKGLELIEAHWLFDVPVERVEVVIHPQSVIHSIVKFKDGSALGQMGWPDMRLPIQYALLYPERVPNLLPPWNPVDSPSLTFEDVDHATFPSIGLARQAAAIGGTMPAIFNAANEEAANAFLAGACGFLNIPSVVEKSMSRIEPVAAHLDSILQADNEARLIARELMQTHA